MQKGFIQLGIIALIVLTVGLFATSKLASNPNLTFFNIASEASGVGEKSCTGCEGRIELRWDRKKGKCFKRESTICRPKPPSPRVPIEKTPIPTTPSPTPIQGTPTPSDPIYPKVLLLIYNPIIENQGNKKLTEVKNWNDPVNLTNTFVNSVKNASSGLVNYQVVQTVEVDSYPIKQDGFTYTDSSYLACISNPSSCHQPDLANYPQMISTSEACDKRNSGTIDELWIWGGPYFGYWESNLAGPNSYWYNSPPTTGTGCTKLLPIMGFSYERGEAEMFEDLAHRVEATMTKVYGAWSKDESNDWNKFSLLDVDKPGKGGCGNAHNGVNAANGNGYDRENPRKVLSLCEDFKNYPRLTGKSVEVSCNSWGCTALGYLKWWFSHLPKEGGKSNGKLNNWWEYLAYPEKAL